MSVAVPLPGDNPVAKLTAEVSKEKGSTPKYSMAASAPPMEPPPMYFPPVLEGEELKETIASLVEYYLSRSYLEGDPYMVSQMNADRYLPVSLIVEKISSVVMSHVETDDVLNVISSSKDMSLDETKTLVCPNIKLVRNTIILRELPGITEPEIRELFAKEETLAKPTEITKEISDCWFVSFESESLALEALSYIRTQTYNGTSIRARLKQESLLRSSYVVDPVSLPPYFPTPGDADGSGQSLGHWDNLADRGHDSKDHRRNQRFDRRGGRPQRKGRDFNAAGGNSIATGNEQTQGRHGYGHNRNRRHGGAATGGTSTNSPTPPNSTTGQNGLAGGNGRKRVNSGKRGAPTPINLGLAHFPPLNAQEKSGNANTQLLKKWSKSDLVAVIKALGESPVRPGQMPSDCVAVLASPNPVLEVSKPMPKVETVDLPSKPKHNAPDYKAVVSAKPIPGNVKPVSTASHTTKGGNKSKGNPPPSNGGGKSSGKGKHGKDETEEEAGSKKNVKKEGEKKDDGFHPVQKNKNQKKRQNQKAAAAEAKGKSGSPAGSSSPKASPEASPPQGEGAEGPSPVASEAPNGGSPRNPAPGSDPQSEGQSESGQMSWARRVQAKGSSPPATASPPASSSPSPTPTASSPPGEPTPSLSSSQ